ncbi:hypothetical protein C3943_26420 [Lysinibacillus sp. B2A1]|nr:hypothetical protein C3943_26420 [Lysinibacillus sp. B2A1]
MVKGFFVNTTKSNEGGFPFQATRFPVGERRAASCADAPCRVSSVSLSHGSRVALHSNQQ